MTSTEPVIEVEGLTVRYGSFTAVDQVDLAVGRGEVFGFLGPNGAGKTSTIRVLLDLLRPDAGEARVLGRDVMKGGGDLRGSIGFLPGDLCLFPNLTGAKTLQLFSKLQSRPPRSRQAVLERLGFPAEALERRVRTYSTGMRQMLGITLAFQHDPMVLVLDEPTAGLDPFVRDAFLALVREQPERGASVLLSSHVLAEVESCAHRVGLIDCGRIKLVESIESMRRDRPRRVVLRYADGRVEHLQHQGPPADLLAKIDTHDLVDLEIRPTGLDEVVRSVIGKGRGT